MISQAVGQGNIPI